jgi:hypothetical protein
MGTVRFAGMHGYHPSEPTADAVLLATAPVGQGDRSHHRRARRTAGGLGLATRERAA